MGGSLTVGRVNVLLSAEAASFQAGMDKAVEVAGRVGQKFERLASQARDLGEKGMAGLEHGFKGTQTALLHLTDATGSLGGHFAKVGGAAAHLVLSGLNPIALAATAAALGIGMLVERWRASQDEAVKSAKAAEEWVKKIRKLQAEVDDLRTGGHSANLQDWESARQRVAQLSAEILAHEKKLRSGMREDTHATAVNEMVQEALAGERAELKEATNSYTALTLARQKDATTAEVAAEKKADAQDLALEGMARQAREAQELAAVQDEEERALRANELANAALFRSIKDITPEQRAWVDEIFETNRATIVATFALKREEDQLGNIRKALAAAAAADVDRAETLKTLGEESRTAEREAATSREKGRRRDLDEFSTYLGEKIVLEDQLATTLAEMDMSAADLAVAAARAKYAKQLEDLESYGVDTVEFQRRIDEKLAEVRKKAIEDEEEDRRRKADKAALEGADFGAGFEVGVRQVEDRLKGLGAFGADVGQELTEGLGRKGADALQAIADGSRAAKDAFRDMALSIAGDLARLGLERALLGAGTSLFGALAGGGSSDAGPGASVATVSVLADSLVARGPGRVFTPEQAPGGGGDGGTQVFLTVRPPAVIADDVAAKMSRDSKAAIVHHATRRGLRRGWRPQE